VEVTKLVTSALVEVDAEEAVEKLDSEADVEELPTRPVTE